MFNPQDFLDASVTDAMDTKITPCPQGEFTGVIEKILPEQWKNGDGTKTGIKLSITWIVEDQGVKDFLQRDTVTVRQQIFLDVSEDGRLETGPQKNVGLGRLREAVGLNVAGQPFTFSMLPGRMAKIVIKHRENPNDADTPFAEVQKVGAAS